MCDIKDLSGMLDLEEIKCVVLYFGVKSSYSMSASVCAVGMVSSSVCVHLRR